MGDHFVLLVDRLLTESTLGAAIENKRPLLQDTLGLTSEVTITDLSSKRMDTDIGSYPRKIVECRICQDEDEASNVETPCSCRGSLKYAHRKCVQRWCNEKGDTICEICLQQFKPGYTAPPPPPPFHYGGIPMTFRGNWDISEGELQNSRVLAMVSTDRDFLDHDFEYPAPTRNLACCRIVAIIFLVLLVLRHTLPIIVSGAGEYSFTLFTLMLLRTVGILLPTYIMVKAFTAIQRRRHQQGSHNFSLDTSDEELELPQHHPQARLIHVR